MLIYMHLITLFRIMNPHHRCLQAKVKYGNEPKQVVPKSEYLSRSLETNAIWTFDTEYIYIWRERKNIPNSIPSIVIAVKRSVLVSFFSNPIGPNEENSCDPSGPGRLIMHSMIELDMKNTISCHSVPLSVLYYLSFH